MQIKLVTVKRPDARVHFKELIAPPFSDTEVGIWIHKDSRRQTLFLESAIAEEWEAAIESKSSVVRLKALPYAFEDQATKVAAFEALERRMTQVEVRTGQSKFRTAVLARYGNRCAITQTDIPEITEAAHIIPYGKSTLHRNDPHNGICLRVDLHRMFDAGLLWIEGNQLFVSDSVDASEYRALHGTTISPQPSPELCSVREEWVKTRKF